MFNSSEECFLLLQNTLLTGISNVSFNSSVRENYQQILGGTTIKRKINSPSEITCTFNKLYNGRDFLQSLTGQVNMSGQFVHGTGGLDFNQAAISNYSLNLGEDGFGNISIEMKIRGDIKPATLIRTGSASGDVGVINETPTIAFLDLDSGASAIKSINYSSSINSKPTYEIGSIKSSDTKIVSPVVNNISVSMQALNEEVEDITGLINKENFNKNISIIFSNTENKDNAAEIAQAKILAEKIKDSGVNIDDLDFGYGACALNAYEFPRSVLKSQNIQSNAGEIINLKKDYVSYYSAENNQSAVEHPANLVSCDTQILTVRTSLSEALNRLASLGTFREFVDFEDFSTGTTNNNLNLARINEFVDFEGFVTGTTNTNLNLLRIKEFVDFESFATGSTNNNLIQITGVLPEFFPSTGEHFEDVGGVFAKIDALGPRTTNLVLIEKPKQFVDFELINTGSTNADLFLIDKTKQFENFELINTGSTNTNLHLV